MFTLKQIKEATKAILVNADENTTVKGVSTDTRSISSGELFIALKGDRFDGHRFLKEAFDKGAPAAVVSSSDISIKKPIIRVDDTKRALADIAYFYRQKLKIPIIGITGSNGKTTVKDMIAHILSKKYKILKTHNTENNFIGVPLTLLKIKDESYAVVEMGTNIPGEIDFLAKIVSPYVGLITNIGSSHLEGLKSKENILSEKSKLFEHLEKNGYAVINNDDPILSSLKLNHKILKYGINNRNGCDFYASGIECDLQGLHFIVNDNHRLFIPVVGGHNAHNALAAIAAVSVFGIDIEFCKNAFLDFKTEGNRFHLTAKNGISFIDDTYNSNPLSMEVAIKEMRNLKTSGRRIIVSGDMLELGEDSDRFHYDIGKAIADLKIDYLITVGKQSLSMAKGALDNGMVRKSIMSFDVTKEAAAALKDIAKKDDIVLVKGSRAMKMEEVIKCFTTSYTT